MRSRNFFNESKTVEKRKVVAIYTRVSTSEQVEDGYSIFLNKNVF